MKIKFNRSNPATDFEVKDELHPSLWKDNKLEPKVREQLLIIAQEFIDSLKVPNLDIKDIILTGSLANYNWADLSDVDLHVLVDLDELKIDPELLRDFFNLKKMSWNNVHDIKIYGHEVETYVQDINEPHHSTGVYSIQNDEWVTEPKKENPVLNIEGADKKADSFMREIDSLERLSPNTGLKRASNLKDKIKKLRKCGLEKGGVFSTENLAFKMLRNEGYLEKLNNYKNSAYDSLHSLKENKKK